MQLLLLLTLVAATPVDEISPSDPRLQYVGRWDRSDSNSPWCAWQGSSLRFRFRGESCSAILTNTGEEEYIRILIDGEALPESKIPLQPGRHRYQLCSNLKPGEHEVEIVKETYLGKGRMHCNAIQIPAGQILSPPPPKPLRIAFYGDSNLAGYSLENERNDSAKQYRGSHFTFAGIVARMLDADYQNISSSGATLAGKPNSGLTFFDRMDFHSVVPRWDFDRFPADICVINLGANDISSKSKLEIKRDYRVLLDRIRQAHPNAHIVLMNAYGWSRQEPANYTDEVVAEMADCDLSRLTFPWFFNEWHGCEYDHGGMAHTLAAHLATINPAWKIRHKSDVFDGFSRDGDVANGSFEQVAPFGGFGWRYRDNGITRVHDPAQSPDGEWYLRLSAKGATHQPIPASPGQTFKAQLELRGENATQAELRLEFRDQEWRHQIPSLERRIPIKVDTEWKTVHLQIQVPKLGQADDSHQPWQMIFHISANDAPIHVDKIQFRRQLNACRPTGR